MAEPKNPVNEEALLGQLEWVRVLAHSLVWDSHLADDLSQETLVKALRFPPRQSSTGLRGWLATVLRNELRSHRRRESRRLKREQATAPQEVGAISDDVLERAELHRKLVEVVLDLEDPYRTTVLLRFFDGLDTRQIAARLEIEPATVRSRIKRGLDSVRERLDSDYGDRRHWGAVAVGLVTAPNSTPGASTAATTSVSVSALLVHSVWIHSVSR